MRSRIELEVGSLEYEDFDVPRVRVGDRMLPREVFATFPNDAAGPALRLRLAVVDGVPQCRELHIECKPEGRDIRTADLRKVALENWIEQLYALTATRIVFDRRGRPTHTVHEVSTLRMRGAVRAVQQARAGARRSITPELLKEVAKVYRANVNSRPTEAVRQTFGVAYRTAASYVERARAAGLLPPTVRGKRRA